MRTRAPESLPVRYRERLASAWRCGCDYRVITLNRLWAPVTIALGTALVGFNPNRWDPVFLVLPRGHGIHVRDAIGVALIAFGTVILWRAPNP